MSLEDLLGTEVQSAPPPPRLSPYGRPLGRPVGSTKPLRAMSDDARSELSLKLQEVHNLAAGVPVSWLAKVFRMNQEKVKDALRNCPILGTGRNGGSVYDVKTAAAYLVDPVTDLDAYLKTLDPKRLPLKLQDAFWAAKIREMKARVQAGGLWPTHAVLEVLGDTFKTMKSTVQLWSDLVEEETGLTIEQRNAVIKLSDRLLDDIHQALVEQASNQQTESWLKELDSEPE